MAKERSRCDRREHDREFVLLLIDTTTANPSEKKLLGFCQMVRETLRITDEIGWRDGELCILLPETDREGGNKVSDTIGEICFDLNLKLDIDVLVYPDDDDISSNSFEVGDNATVEAPLESKGTQEASEPLRTGFTASGSKATPIWKRALDIFGAMVALTIFSPIFILTAVAIKLDSRGPILFRQKREGKDGRIFEILKFRTMRTGAENEQSELRARESNEQDGPAFKLTNDPRVTRVGKYLRKVCLDELPQMFNVLIGDMSMVGPRPLPVQESHQSKIWHRRRLEVLPGLTCIWQVQGRRDIEFDEWMRMDIEYIRRRGLLLDLRLLFQTAMVVILHRGSV
ncbi:sugar transferase [bacterium]|nr:sugar transferase [bacterium]